jgi:hypothetical protein
MADFLGYLLIALVYGLPLMLCLYVIVNLFVELFMDLFDG